MSAPSGAFDPRAFDPRAFGRRVAEARKAARLNQTELAERLGRSRATISNIERGHSLTSFALLVDLAAVLQMSIDWLVSGVVVEPPTDVTLPLRQIRASWQGLVDANRELGWPDVADVVRLPRDFVRDLDALLDTISVGRPA